MQLIFPDSQLVIFHKRWLFCTFVQLLFSFFFWYWTVDCGDQELVAMEMIHVSIAASLGGFLLNITWLSRGEQSSVMSSQCITWFHVQFRASGLLGLSINYLSNTYRLLCNRGCTALPLCVYIVDLGQWLCAQLMCVTNFVWPRSEIVRARAWCSVMWPVCHTNEVRRCRCKHINRKPFTQSLCPWSMLEWKKTDHLWQTDPFWE